MAPKVSSSSVADHFTQSTSGPVSKVGNGSNGVLRGISRTHHRSRRMEVNLLPHLGEAKTVWVTAARSELRCSLGASALPTVGQLLPSPPGEPGPPLQTAPLPPEDEPRNVGK